MSNLVRKLPKQAVEDDFAAPRLGIIQEPVQVIAAMGRRDLLLP